jgi:triosephosphate isomerase (TIM)
LKDAGCSHVILGHSERRTDHHESDALIRAKVKAAREAGLVAILCVGETAQERDAGRCLDTVSRQIAGSLPEGLSAAELVIAYEPVWAIGTGRTPTPADIAAVHAHLRAALEGRVAGAASVRLLYGGSVKPNNAWELLRIANVDGALVGGASLDAADFWAIAEAAA